jgi:aminoglycoside phosphotransferase (APT) family kinase protein
MSRALRIGELGRRLAELTGEPITVDEGTARIGGMSHANLIGSGAAGPRVVVRIPPDRGPLEPYDVAAEAGWLRRAIAGGVPAPEPLDLDPTGERFGVPALITGFVSGEVLLPADVGLQRGEAVGRELVRVLVGIQAVELSGDLVALALAGGEGAAGGGGAVPAFALRMLRRWGEVFDRERSRRPILAGEVVRRWLADRLPAATEPVLVHGDYRLGNLIWRGETVVAVLDWEDAAAGDRHYDLAWLLMGTRGPDDLVMNAWPRRELLEFYAELSGRELDPEVLRWWEVAVGWVRMAMEIKLLRLSAAASPPDLRGLIWEFGHGSAARAMLERIEDGALRP